MISTPWSDRANKVEDCKLLLPTTPRIQTYNLPRENEAGSVHVTHVFFFFRKSHVSEPGRMETGQKQTHRRNRITIDPTFEMFLPTSVADVIYPRDTELISGLPLPGRHRVPNSRLSGLRLFLLVCVYCYWILETKFGWNGGISEINYKWQCIFFMSVPVYLLIFEKFTIELVARIATA